MSGGRNGVSAGSPVQITGFDGRWNEESRPVDEKRAAEPCGGVREVYEAHYDFVWRSLRRLGVPSAELDDLAQEVFLVVHRRLGEFAHRASVTTWLFGIVIKVVQGHRRTTRRHLRRVDALAWVRTTAPTMRSEVERIDDADLLLQLLDALSFEKRSVFILCELERMSAREAGEALRVSPNTVSSRLRAARRELKHRLTELHDGGGPA